VQIQGARLVNQGHAAFNNILGIKQAVRDRGDDIHDGIANT